VSTSVQDGQSFRHIHHFLKTLRTLALNLLRINGYRSIRDGQLTVSHDIGRMLGWMRIRPPQTG